MSDQDECRGAHAGDDPVAAFERLRGEVSLLRHAVEGLTTARENIEIPTMSRRWNAPKRYWRRSPSGSTPSPKVHSCR
jgi:hypothetical protein